VIGWLKAAPYIALIAVSGGAVWWVMDMRADLAAQDAHIARLERDKADMAATLAAMDERLSLARSAALVAQKERARMRIQAAKYEQVRTAFRNGDFNAPLPDDFRHLVACLLHRSTAGADGHEADCP
jgi:hypothetical protein